MDNTSNKKSTYHAESQKRYNEKRKQIAASVDNNYYDEIVKHLQKKGYSSVSSYILNLIHADMNKSE